MAPVAPASPDVSALLLALTRANDRSDWAGADACIERLDALPDGTAAGLRARMHGVASHSLYRRNRLRQAAHHAAVAMQWSGACTEANGRSEGLVAWARIEWSVGDLDEALARLRAARELGPDDARLNVHLANLLGLVQAELGHLDESATMHREALRAARRARSADLQLLSMTNLIGRLNAIGERRQAAGRRARAQAAWRQALAVFDRAEALTVRHRLEVGLPHALVACANVLANLGRSPDAMAALARLRRLVEQHPDRTSLPHAAATLARLLGEAGDREGARIALADGLAEADALGARARQSALHRQASELEEADGRFAEALQHFKRFHALREECAIDAAQRKHIAMAVLMDTERAMREAQAERQRALQLTEANHALREQAAELSRAALADPLTGLANRRFLEEELPRLHAQARATGLPFHVAILDIDHFKQVNDRFSHACGDAVLREVGALLTRHAREGDICARYGGEEFVLILPGGDADAAQAACERHRRAMELHDWRPVHADLRVTVSIGVADAAPHDAVANALAVADARLYAAKRGGRNRIVATG